MMNGHPEAAGARGGTDVIGTQARTQPADLTDVRTTNLAVVLRYVRTHAPCSRADIAAHHRAEQGDRVEPGRRPAGPAPAARDRADREPDRPPGRRCSSWRAGRTRRSASRWPPTISPRSRSTSPASGCCPGGARSPGWQRDARPGRGRGGGAGRPGGRQVLAGRAAEVLGLTVGVPGLGHRQRRRPVRAAPRLVRPGAARRRWSRRCGSPDYAVVGGQRRQPGRAGRAPRRAARRRPQPGRLIGEVGVGAGIIADGRLLRGDRGLAGRDRPPAGRPGRPALPLRAARLPGGVRRLPALVRGALPAPDGRSPTTAGGRRPSCGGPAPATGDRGRAARGRPAAGPRRRDARRSRSIPEVVVLGGYFVAALAPWSAARGGGRGAEPRGRARRGRLPGGGVHPGQRRGRDRRRGTACSTGSSPANCHPRLDRTA